MCERLNKGVVFQVIKICSEGKSIIRITLFFFSFFLYFLSLRSTQRSHYFCWSAYTRNETTSFPGSLLVGRRETLGTRLEMKKINHLKIICMFSFEYVIYKTNVKCFALVLLAPQMECVTRTLVTHLAFHLAAIARNNKLFFRETKT